MRVFGPNSVSTGMKAHAVRLAHAIAAALADFFVDHHAQRWFFQLSARAQAALFGGALLIVNDHRDAGDLFQFAHDFRKFVAIAQPGIARPAKRRRTLRDHR